MGSLSVVIVTHNHREVVGRSLAALAGELAPEDEVIVVDNASDDGTAATVRELHPDANLVEPGANLGFAAGSNRGAAAASGELLVFLNPDAVVEPGFREAIAAPLKDGQGWSAWQGLVTAEEGRVVNAWGGVLHFTGIAWAGGAGEPLDGPPSEASVRSDPAPPEPGFLSGACLAIPRRTFLDHGGFAGDFFLYQEDVDLSLRLRLAGGRLGLVPAARVDHEYEFAKGGAKWRYLERNRWATLIRTYPAPLFLLIAPALAATELALIPVSIAGGWLPQRLLAWGDVLRALPRLYGERRRIQAGRAISAGQFARALEADLDSRYLGRAGRSRLLRAGLRAYWRGVLALLGARSPGETTGS